MTEIKEGYDIPTDLQHTPKHWFGLSNKQALLAAITVLSWWGWHKIASLLYIPSPIYRLGFILIGVLAICTIFLELDMWMYRMVRWIVAPFYVTHFDKAAKQISGIIGIEDDHYWNNYGDVCAILRLSAINSDRVDADKSEIVEKFDKDFLNALPCPVQIVGYTYNYNLDPYISSMLSYANNLPKKVMEYRIAHLNFYKKYIGEKNIRERVIYMIVKTDSRLADPAETLDVNVAIISRNLTKSGTYARRLVGDEISTTMVMVATGIGEEGMQYMEPYTEVEG